MPAFEDAATRHERPCDPRRLVSDGDRDDAHWLSGEQRDKARIDRVRLLLGVSDQRGCTDNQELPPMFITHLSSAPQALLAATRTLPQGQSQPGGELAPRRELARVGHRRGKRGGADRPDTRDRRQAPGPVVTPLQSGEPQIELAQLGMKLEAVALPAWR